MTERNGKGLTWIGGFYSKASLLDSALSQSYRLLIG